MSHVLFKVPTLREIQRNGLLQGIDGNIFSTLISLVAFTSHIATTPLITCRKLPPISAYWGHIPEGYSLDDLTEQANAPDPAWFNAAEMGALAHLYRGELYRSKVWRQRLDATTNWAVVLTGVALSITFSNARSSPVPLVLVGLMVLIFLYIEARRYRYFDIWRTRTRLLELYFFGPILRREPILRTSEWNQALIQDLTYLHFHISMWEALGRRLRRNYGWLFVVLGISYVGKLLVHPTPLETLAQFWKRAAVGPIPGQVVVTTGALFYCVLLVLALTTLIRQRAAGRAHPDTGRPDHEDPILRMAI